MNDETMSIIENHDEADFSIDSPPPLLPVVAIVGRPNVGKSTLFNRLTRTRNALVGDRPGLTRDRQYGYCSHEERTFLLVDTGGIGEVKETIDALMEKQSYEAIKEADLILFMVDARSGLTSADEELAGILRKYNKPIYLVVNKIDGLDADSVMSEFHAIGFEQVIGIAATHGRGVTSLLNRVIKHLPERCYEEKPEDLGIKLAIVGKPNVGKSTLVNRMLGEERVVVCDQPGTTRDSIFVPLERRGQKYTLIDTAGVRRRSRVSDGVEKFSVIKTLQAIEEANVVLFLIDAREGIADQDLKLLGLILNTGRALVIAVNKWDGLDSDIKTSVKTELQRRLAFVDYAKWHFISALHGTNVGHLFTAVNKAYRSATQELQTSRLTSLLEEALKQHQPPLVNGRRIKLRFAHSGGRNPPLIVIHGNQTKSVPVSYVRYLENFYREALKIVGSPIRIELRASENPYKDKKNVLTPRQQYKRKRMMRYVKKK